MSDRTYALTEIVGTSGDSVDAAIRNAISRSNNTLRNLAWFTVQEIRGHIENGEPAHYQVTLKVGFRLEGSDAEA